MATSDDFDPDQATRDLMRKSLKIKRQFWAPIFDQKHVTWRKRNFRSLELLSTLPDISLLWSGLSSAQRTAWDVAASYSNLTGYQLFVKDTSYRINNNLAGLGTPNNNHQFKVLEWESAPGSEEFYLRQDHESEYTILVKNIGQKNAYTPVVITEVGTGVFSLEFDYFSDLDWTYEPDFFGVYIYFSGTKNGSPSSDSFWFDLEPQTDWTRFSEEFTPDLDEYDFYYVEFDAYPLNGLFRADNFNFYHDGQNWAFDPKCDNIDKEYYFRIDKWEFPWFVDSDIDPSKFESVYLE